MLGFLLFFTTICIVGQWRFLSQYGADINPVLLLADMLSHACLICALITWVLRPTRGHVAMLPLGLIVVLFSVAAGGIGTSLAAQTSVALAACLGYAVGSQVILGSSPLLPSESRRRTDRGGSRAVKKDNTLTIGRSQWLAPILSLLTLSLLMMGTSVIANVTDRVLPSIQKHLRDQLKASLDSVSEQSLISGTRYVQGGQIGSIRRLMIGNPLEISLQVHCTVPPGYLRGKAFDLYRRGRWLDSGSSEFTRFGSRSASSDRVVLPTGVGSVELKKGVNRQLRRFPLANSKSSETINLEIHNDPMKGQMVFLPLATEWLEAGSREIIVTEHDTVRIGVDVTRPYVAGVGTVLPEVNLSESTRLFATDVAATILPELESKALELCQSASDAKAKAAAISSYFRRNYEYSLSSVERPRRVDPLTHFLRTEHPAHCEFFASATALMLRSVGVPTRYVTGYVVNEPSDEETELWLARNKDAHAWVEAYDDNDGKWFPVESTPGRVYQTVKPEDDEIVAADLFGGLLSRTNDENEGWIASVVTWLRSVRTTNTLLVIFRFAQLPLFFVLVFVLWSRRRNRTASFDDPNDMQSRRMLRQADRRLRKHQLIRRPSETLYQFADRIDRTLQAGSLRVSDSIRERLVHAAAWYRSYADARYQGRLPDPLAETGLVGSKRSR